jgi:2-haloalkanoic acid dehalogenase type II
MSPPGGAKPFVLFDFGQTLVDLRGLVSSLAVLVEDRYPALTSRGSDLARAWMRRSVSKLPRREDDPFVPELVVVTEALVELLAAEGVAIRPPSARSLLRKAWDDFETTVQFCPGVSLEWLRDIRRISAGLALVTDGDNENIERLVRRLELRSMFDVIVTSENARAYKPNRRIYDAALQALGAKPNRSVFISDAALDLQGAAALGMHTVLLGQSFVTEPKDLPRGSVRVPDPADLPRALTRLAAADERVPSRT